MNMNNKNARSRMKSLFVQYHCLISKHGLKWNLKDNEKFAVTHVLLAMRLPSLKERLRSDLEFTHHETKKDLNEFLNHALKVSEALQIVEACQRRTKSDPYYRPNHSGNRNQPNSSEDPRTPKY